MISIDHMDVTNLNVAPFFADPKEKLTTLLVMEASRNEFLIL